MAGGAPDATLHLGLGERTSPVPCVRVTASGTVTLTTLRLFDSVQRLPSAPAHVRTALRSWEC
jgi:hypothetical protein